MPFLLSCASVQWLFPPANIEERLTYAVITMGLHVMTFIGILQVLVSIVFGVVCAQSDRYDPVSIATQMLIGVPRC